MNNCKNRLIQLIPLISLPDKNRRIFIVILLAQYLTARYYDKGYADGDKWMVTDKKVVAASPPIIKENVAKVLNARNDINHCYQTR